MPTAIVSEVPTPWLCLQEDLRQAGIDPAPLRREGETIS
jgi:NitT/TauT family transport system substrate-binding protein